MMEYRILPSVYGGFTVQAGITHKGGENNPAGSPGVTMRAFIVYQSGHCDSYREAVATVERLRRKGRD